jgi:hypothetical protein
MWSVEGATWTLSLAQHPEDPVFGGGQGRTTGGGKMQVGLLVRECRVELPAEITEPHPDLEALARSSSHGPGLSGGCKCDGVCPGRSRPWPTSFSGSTWARSTRI